MSNSTNEEFSYGVGDSSYKAAGEQTGLRKLCTDFYTLMDTLPEAKLIREMHKCRIPGDGYHFIPMSGYHPGRLYS